MSAVVTAQGASREDLILSNRRNRVRGWEVWLFGEDSMRGAIRALLIVVVGSMMVQNTVQPLRVGGNSMLPTFQNQEYLLADRLAYRWKAPAIGDVVAIRTAQSGVTILKRILAGPGDEILMVDGRLCLNGVWLEEAYINDQGGFSTPLTSLGANEYWVIGDNRRVSEFGKVHRANLIGKVW